MREMDHHEVENVSGGVLQVLATVVLLYEAAQIATDFYRGYEAGYNQA